MEPNFTLDDLAAQLRMLKPWLLKRWPSRIDPVEEFLDYFRPGRAELLAQLEMVLAATEPSERQDPSSIGPAQRERIAAVSGVGLASVEAFFTGFERLRSRMDELAGMSFFQRLRVSFGKSGFMIMLPWLLVICLVMVVARVALK
jgi:signal recognition particle subunit SRP54